MTKKNGIAQIPLILGLLLMAVAVPIVTKLAQDNQDNRNLATNTQCTLGQPTATCVMTNSGIVCTQPTSVGVKPTVAPTAGANCGGLLSKPLGCGCFIGQCGSGAGCVGGVCVPDVKPTTAVPTTVKVPTQKCGYIGSEFVPCGMTVAPIKPTVIVPTTAVVPTQKCGYIGSTFVPCGSTVVPTKPYLGPTAKVGCTKMGYSCSGGSSYFCGSMGSQAYGVLSESCSNGCGANGLCNPAPTTAALPTKVVPTPLRGPCTKGGYTCSGGVSSYCGFVSGEQMWIPADSNVCSNGCGTGGMCAPAPVATLKPTSKPLPTAAPCTKVGYSCKGGSSFYCSSDSLGGGQPMDVLSEECSNGCGSSGLCNSGTATGAPTVAKTPTQACGYIGSTFVPCVSPAVLPTVKTPTAGPTAKVTYKLTPTPGGTVCAYNGSQLECKTTVCAYNDATLECKTSITIGGYPTLASRPTFSPSGCGTCQSGYSCVAGAKGEPVCVPSGQSPCSVLPAGEKTVNQGDGALGCPAGTSRICSCISDGNWSCFCDGDGNNTHSCYDDIDGSKGTRADGSSVWLSLGNASSAQCLCGDNYYQNRNGRYLCGTDPDPAGPGTTDPIDPGTIPGTSCVEQCPGTDGVLRSCTPAESDGSSKDSLCAWAGRSETCGGKSYCCPAADGAWTTDMTKCPTTVSKCTQCPTNFACYSKDGEYKWFAVGMQMDGFNLESVDVNCLNVVAKPAYLGKSKGDANCDGTIDTADYSLWHKEFYDGDAGAVNKLTWNADFTGPSGICDGIVDTADYSLWHKFFYELMGNN